MTKENEKQELSVYDRSLQDTRLNVLDEMLRCNVACSGNFKPTKHKYEEQLIQWLYENLPTLPYVVNQIVNYIFSNGLTTGDEEQDKKLESFLYEENIKGTTNFSVIQEALRKALIFPKSGLRYLSLEDGLINVESKNYAPLVEDNEEYYGFKNIVGYLVSFDDIKLYEIKADEIQFDRELLERQGVIVDKQQRLLILSKEEFANIRMNPANDNGESPLMLDRQRIQLLTTIYERLNYDLEYDGPGRLIFRLKDNYLSSDENEIGASEVMNETIKAKTDRAKQAKAEAAAIGEQIKQSTSDSVILYSNMFEDFEHLPRVTKSTEFFGYLENEGVILSQIFGIPPTLIGLGKISGNVSMEKIIDNAMLNAIIPIREKFAVQLSSLLADKIGVDKIYFDKYEMKQVIDENDKRAKVVDMIVKMKNAGYDNIANELAEMLENDIKVNDGQLKKLSVNLKSKLKKFITGDD